MLWWPIEFPFSKPLLTSSNAVLTVIIKVMKNSKPRLKSDGVIVDDVTILLTN